MKVAVTGATGFVGRHAVRALWENGLHVVAVCRSRENLFQPDSKLEIVTLDIGNIDNPHDQMGNPDVLLHLAWEGLPRYHSEHHLTQELPKQIAFLEACVRGGLKRLVVTGTCLEYGMQSGCLDENLIGVPTTAYGKAKDLLRSHLQSSPHMPDLKLTWLRLFYLYGPGQASTSLYSQLHRAIANGDKSFPMSPGDQQRDFLPIETATTQLASLILKTPAAGVVNLCSGAPMTVAEFANSLLRNWNTEMELDFGRLNYPDYEPHAFWGSTKKLQALLQGFERA